MHTCAWHVDTRQRVGVSVHGGCAGWAVHGGVCASSAAQTPFWSCPSSGAVAAWGRWADAHGLPAEAVVVVNVAAGSAEGQRLYPPENGILPSQLRWGRGIPVSPGATSGLRSPPARSLPGASLPRTDISSPRFPGDEAVAVETALLFFLSLPPPPPQRHPGLALPPPGSGGAPRWHFGVQHPRTACTLLARVPAPQACAPSRVTAVAVTTLSSTSARGKHACCHGNGRNCRTFSQEKGEKGGGEVGRGGPVLRGEARPWGNADPLSQGTHMSHPGMGTTSCQACVTPTPIQPRCGVMGSWGPPRVCIGWLWTSDHPKAHPALRGRGKTIPRPHPAPCMASIGMLTARCRLCVADEPPHPGEAGGQRGTGR